jgi:NADH-quinone oxidoreductase subunit C/D
MIAAPTIAQEISERLGPVAAPQETLDHIPTFWVAKDRVFDLLRFLREDIDQPYKMLYDLSAIDERMRQHRDGQPASDFTVVYHLLSFERNEYVRIKVALAEDRLSLPSITRIWPSANWYEREVWAEGTSDTCDRDGAVSVAARQGSGRAGGASLPSRGMGDES